MLLYGLVWLWLHIFVFSMNNPWAYSSKTNCKVVWGLITSTACKYYSVFNFKNWLLWLFHAAFSKRMSLLRKYQYVNYLLLRMLKYTCKSLYLLTSVFSTFPLEKRATVMGFLKSCSYSSSFFYGSGGLSYLRNTKLIYTRGSECKLSNFSTHSREASQFRGWKLKRVMVPI